MIEDGGFYHVFDTLYRKLFDIEKEHGKLVDTSYESFGNESSSAEQVLQFYCNWSNFMSQLSFAWADKYNTTEAPSRPVRRVMEKENKKFRDTAKRKYQDTVRALTSQVRRWDKRIVLIEQERSRKKSEELERQNQVKAKMLQDKKELRERRMRQMQEDEGENLKREEERSGAYLLADESEDEEEEVGEEYFDEKGNVLGEVDEFSASAELASDNVVIEEEAEQEAVVFACEVCSKHFHTQTQLDQHLASKAHRAKSKAAQSNEKKSKGSVGTKAEKGMDIDHLDSLTKSLSDKAKVGLAEVEKGTSDARPPQPTTSSETEAATDFTCRRCGVTCVSKNKLHEHVKAFRHDVAAATETSAGTDSPHSKSKKKKGIRKL